VMVETEWGKLWTAEACRLEFRAVMSVKGTVVAVEYRVGGFLSTMTFWSG
jgi:hypothetical protein